jgi:thiol-disulfide isomerase/thioredoxin
MSEAPVSEERGPVRAGAARSAWRSRLAEVALALALVFGMGLWQTRGHLRGVAPDGPLQALDGGPVALSSLRGKPVLLAFWAPWCGVCKAESQNLSWVRSLVGDRAQVVTVAAAYHDVAQVRAYLRDRGADYPVLLGGDAWTAQFGVSAFPSVYFLDAQGAVRSSSVGYTTTLGLLLRLWLA